MSVVSETPLDRWLALHSDKWSDDYVPEAMALELRKLVRTAQREAAARGFKEEWRAHEVNGEYAHLTEREAWAASALHAELENPT